VTLTKLLDFVVIKQMVCSEVTLNGQIGFMTVRPTLE